MDELKECALSFQQLFDKDYVISAQKADRVINVTIFFTNRQFFHLIGLNKLIDIPELSNPSKQNIFERILNGEITYNTIKSSYYIDTVKERMKYFKQLESLLNNEIILKFNRDNAHSTINATMLLYQKKDDIYLHLFLTSQGKNSEILIPCSFFPRKDN